MTFGVALGAGAWQVAFGVAGCGGAWREAWRGVRLCGVGVALGVVGGVAGVAFGMASGVTTGMAIGVGIGVGAIRLMFYVFEWPLALWQTRLKGPALSRLTRHPVVWDELGVGPLPAVHRLLTESLREGLEQSLALVCHIGANPFQMWAVQRGLSDFLLEQADPLSAFYQLAHLPGLDRYLFLPVIRLQFRRLPSARLVLLAEVGQRFVATSSDSGENLERMVWVLTRRGRCMMPTPLSRFSSMLYELYRDESELDEQDVAEIRLAEHFAAAYEGVRAYPHGAEVADSFATMDAFLHNTSIEDLATAHQQLAWIQVAH